MPGEVGTGKAEAVYEDGVREMTLPKAEASKHRPFLLDAPDVRKALWPVGPYGLN